MNQAKWNSETIQISNALPSGHRYATIRVYDNGGKSIDRYTVVFMDEPSTQTNCWNCVGMSHDVTSPQGFYQHSECKLGRHLGKRIPFAELPATHQSRILDELKEGAATRKAETKPQGHTPGPWQVGKNGDKCARDHAICADGIVLAKVYGRGYPAGQGWHPQSAADARLISAAPELLGACQKLAQWDAEGDDSDKGARMISEACSMARAAIRKAVQS